MNQCGESVVVLSSIIATMVAKDLTIEDLDYLANLLQLVSQNLFMIESVRNKCGGEETQELTNGN